MTSPTQRERNEMAMRWIVAYPDLLLALRRSVDHIDTSTAEGKAAKRYARAVLREQRKKAAQ